MKNLLYILLLLPLLSCAQTKFGVEGVPMCWTIGSVDSNIIRYVLISSTGKPTKTIAYENAAGQVVNVSGGVLKHGFCGCDTLDNGVVTWEKLAEAVKDSVRGRKDTTVVVLSENKVVDFDFADTKRFANVYFVGKGVTDTAQLIFLNPPAPEQFGTVFHMKSDSGGVAVRFTGSQGANNKNGYFLQPGQRAEIRALYDAVAEFELWEVILVWDSIGGGGNTIYTESDSIRNGNRLVKMASNGSQSFGVGHFSIFPDYDFGDYGLFISPGYYKEMTLLYGREGNYNAAFATSSSAGLLASKSNYATAFNARRSLVEARQGSLSLVVGNGNISNKFWRVLLDSTKFEISRNISGTNRIYELLPASQYPSTISGAISNLTWTTGTPSFLRSQHAVLSGTTDGSGDLTVTFASAMPDATYTVLALNEGTIAYILSAHTKAAGSVKIRVFDAAGAAVASTSVTISYEVKDN